MTAIVGGLWDSMLGEGRRFWIVATSDSHAHYTDAARPGSDFWPGEYQKTYVHAQRSYQRCARCASQRTHLCRGRRPHHRAGRGGEVGPADCRIGETLSAEKGQPITLTVTFRDPDAKNTHGDNPRVSRVDLIVGEVHGASEDANVDRNPTTRVLARFVDKQWVRDGDSYTITTTLPKTERDFYVRIRGTNTQDAEPPMDVFGESPWSDLWFYSEPDFCGVEPIHGRS